MKYAPVLYLKPQYYEPIEEEIMRLWREVIFKPLIAAAKVPEIELMNTGNALLDAIREGTVWYQDGHFTGDYNSSISKDLRAIGALYNTPSRTWSLERSLLPTDIRMAQAAADARYDSLRHSFLHTLADAKIDSIDRLSDIPDQYIKTIDWMNDDFVKTLKHITIAPQLTDAQRGIIAAEWGQNLDLYVKGWASQRILEMREKVQANAFDGRRSSQLIDMLKYNYGVSQRKAKFLARQETSLLLSKFRETRYRDAGSNRYRWSTSRDERVRHDHEKLDGKVFQWDQPPITNHWTGKRNNPGEDFGCRCVGIAIFD